MPNLKIKIAGICCFVDKHNGSNVKRVVMPRDETMMGDGDRHIPFIEVRETDLVEKEPYRGNFPPSRHYTHNNGSVYYKRWELDGHCIELESLDESAPVINTTPAFDRYIPVMNRVDPELSAIPGDDCFTDDPSPEVIVGCLEIEKGTLDVGPLEEIFTSFYPVKNWPAGQTPQWVELLMPVQPGPIVIFLRQYAADGAKVESQIFLKEGTPSITVGNLLLADLEGPGSGKGRTEHFMLYYKLAKDEVNLKTAPAPAIPQVPVNACSPVRWS